MKPRTFSAMAAACLTAIWPAGCENQPGSTGGAPPATQPATVKVEVPKKDKYIVGFSQCTIQEPWRVQMNKDVAEAAARHPNLELRVAVADDKIDKQVNDVENFVTQGVDFLIISPKETARSLTDAVARAYQKKIPVIVLDRRVLGDQYTCFIGADNYKIGLEAGKYARELLGGKGHIVELKGNMTSTPGELRHNGFVAAIKDGLASGAIRIVHDADVDWKEGKAKSEMESALAANAQIDLVYGHNDPAAHGAWMAAKDANRESKIKFIGIDALPHEGIAYVKEGVLSASLQYPTGGDKAIEVIQDMIAGREVPRTITLGTRLFTRETVASGGKAID
ncbi:MAG: hypothetical protein AMXMBFR83_02740 [Phycisphaerae bacterium]